MKPTISNNVLINTMEKGRSQSILESLTDILQKFQNTTQILENWISVTTHSPNRTQHNYALITYSEKFNQLSKKEISGVQFQAQTLQLNYTPAAIQTG